MVAGPAARATALLGGTPMHAGPSVCVAALVVRCGAALSFAHPGAAQPEGPPVAEEAV